MLQFITNSLTVEGTVRQALSAIDGGCRWVQVRMKDAPSAQVLEALQGIAPAIQRVGGTLIVDDHVDLAQLPFVDGVHLGSKDMSPIDARNVLGNNKIIGYTVNDLEAAHKACTLPIDYVGTGPLRFTNTKKALAPVLGLDGISSIINVLRSGKGNIPIVVIGGIVESDVNDVLRIGADGVAVSGAISRADDPTGATRRFVNLLK